MKDFMDAQNMSLIVSSHELIDAHVRYHDIIILTYIGHGTSRTVHLGLFFNRCLYFILYLFFQE